MDILNFISWIRGNRVVTTVDPAKTLIPVGLKDGRRDDEYLAGAITVQELAAQIAPQPTYKVYTALLTQTGISAPTAVVLENTLGVNVTYTYGYPGGYSINFSENILTSGTQPGQQTNFSVIQGCSNDAPFLSGAAAVWAYYSASNEIRFDVYDVSTGSTGDDFMQDMYIEIRVYN
jgi:hypothetical protein